MKKTQVARNVLGALCLLACATNAAWATTNYNETLDFTGTPLNVTIPTPFGNIPGVVGIDINRIDLGSALSGPVDITFSTSYNASGSMLGVLFATDANDTLYSNPSSFAALINPTANIQAVLAANVVGLNSYAFGTNYIKPDHSTANLTSLLNLNFTAGTHYYAFIAGGSAYSTSGQLYDSSVDYTFSIAAVPEPETYAMLLAGLGMVGVVARKRCKTAA